jgi:signal transduction histidine kinase
MRGVGGLRSLFWRLLISYIAIILVALAGVGVIMSGLLRGSLLDGRADELALQGLRLSGVTAEFLAGGVDATTYISLLDLFDAATGARIFVVTPDSRVVAVSGLGPVFGAGTRIRGLWAGHSGPPAPLNLLNTRVTGQDVARVLAGETLRQAGSSRFFREPVVTVGLPVRLPASTPDSPPSGAIFLNAPVAAVGPLRHRVQAVLGLAGAGALVLAAAAGYTLSRSISGPLRQMTKAAREMARGRFAERVPETGPGEVGELARSLNHLAAEAGKVEEMRREFVANVSHELKTPLTAIRGFVEPLIDGTVTVEDRAGALRYLEVIRDETLRLSRLIDDLLDLSRLEAGKERLSMEQVDMGGLARGVLERLDPLFAAKGVEREVVVSPETPPALGDGERLTQVLTNLLTNAIRHTPSGGKVTVEVSPETADARGADAHGVAPAVRMVRVAVHDSGEGIAPDELALIWERFHKADRSHQRTDAGTGLGLPISRRLVEAHGGRAWAESAGPGRGATFVFLIPAAV